jgi:hypothetical protein
MIPSVIRNNYGFLRPAAPERTTRQRRGREIDYRLVAGIAELLVAADSVLAATGERVRACPYYAALRGEAA